MFYILKSKSTNQIITGYKLNLSDPDLEVLYSGENPDEAILNQYKDQIEDQLKPVATGKDLLMFFINLLDTLPIAEKLSLHSFFVKEGIISFLNPPEVRPLTVSDFEGILAMVEGSDLASGYKDTIRTGTNVFLQTHKLI